MICISYRTYRCILCVLPHVIRLPLFFFNDTATTEIYTLSLHDAPSDLRHGRVIDEGGSQPRPGFLGDRGRRCHPGRSEEHTSELQSRQYLVCRLLLEKKKRRKADRTTDQTGHQQYQTNQHVGNDTRETM